MAARARLDTNFVTGAKPVDDEVGGERVMTKEGRNDKLVGGVLLESLLGSLLLLLPSLLGLLLELPLELGSDEPLSPDPEPDPEASPDPEPFPDDPLPDPFPVVFPDPEVGAGEDGVAPAEAD